MIEGTYDLTIYRDSPIDIPLVVVSTTTGDPVSLTGLTPFAAEVREAPGKPVLVSFTVTETDLVNGLLTLEVDAAGTSGIKVCAAKWDLIDKDKRVWISGDVTFKSRISNP